MKKLIAMLMAACAAAFAWADEEITMVEKEIPTFYGMTTYHALMLVGVAAGLILFTISYIMVRRNSKGIKD
jgi:hypothetical protein